jgi:predicted nucleic acid-binding protein
VSFVVLDTDVASAVFRGRTSEQLNARLAGRSLAITFVTVAELTKWTLVRHWGPQRLADMQTFLANLIALPYGDTVATTWGHMQARAQLRGRPRPANDTWIAACCLARSLPLATLNTKDFADFVEHDGLNVIPG